MEEKKRGRFSFLCQTRKGSLSTQKCKVTEKCLIVARNNCEGWQGEKKWGGRGGDGQSQVCKVVLLPWGPRKMFKVQLLLKTK
jgi:hypothetical protein